ncbi:NAD(+) diphosphatase [Celeribacter indicus]|uniref:NAD(+) diphosphatase n=1 Tax=Celeribacter indicus TaxID=1208324 RepID=A0A0B5DZN4_9RHOB|nr:NAD(+) diphosphatase [Celeribacter indicus]AJE48923.1 hydrolase [Celeribacter indicus]
MISRLPDPVTFAAGTLDRAAHLRARAPLLWEAAEARALPFWRMLPLLRDGGGLALHAAQGPLFDGTEERVFLGLATAGAPVFAVDVSHWPAAAAPAAAEATPWTAAEMRCDRVPDAAFRELRSVMALLDPWEAEVAATGRGILEWHARHGFCATCGTRSLRVEGGWRRDCPACAAPHFPRTDPVVIMLVTHGNSVLLGRNETWPERMYSLLAGFVEPGEPVEAAVRREVFEEAGVRIGAVSYVASQPWPFPASLMLGCRAEALGTEIAIDRTEIEDARWVRREDLARAMAGRHPEIAPPRRGALAQFLMNAWLADR